jgi:peptidoglycan/xylan/chitin deacetylase (PgdA/CDA1 family)
MVQSADSRPTNRFFSGLPLISALVPTGQPLSMKQFRNTVIRAGLRALYFTGAHYLLQPIFAGVGAIFMLHHVRPGRDAEFQPNRHLEVAPEFLRAMLSHLRARGIDIVTMDEVQRRLIERNFSRRFACFTLDDGYRDNRDFALPIMRKFVAPFTVYVASDFAQGTGRLWWIALETVARAAGFKTAATTRPGMIFPESAKHLTALPRVSLNGNYQDRRILPVLTSGTATAVWNGFRRVDAA